MRVGMVGARLERRRCCCEGTRRPAEVAHGQRDFGFGDDTARTRQLLMRAEAARGAAQQLACPTMLAELRHRDAAQRERRRVVAQGHALERTKASPAASARAAAAIRESMPTGLGQHGVKTQNF